MPGRPSLGKVLVFAASLSLALGRLVVAQPLSDAQLLARASSWMAGHPIMKAVAGRTVGATCRFPGNGAAYSVFVISFSPSGYVVLNSDDELPLVVAFSPSSSVHLEDQPDNAFRAAMLLHVAKAAEELAAPSERPVTVFAPKATSSGTVIYGPYLETSWNQCHPYNLLCPNDPSGTEYYGYRAPVGCIPTAFAQVFYYHRWPQTGWGHHSYTDSVGEIRGVHSVSLAEPFDWSAMQSSYDPWTATQPGDFAVADLMYRLGVLVEANYESSGTSSSVSVLGTRATEFLFYETSSYITDQATFLSMLEDELSAGYPVVAEIPNHGVVVDGWLNDEGAISYHINYGWGGNNNGWWTVTTIPGGQIWGGCASIRPELMAWPRAASAIALTGQPVRLEWLLPSRREAEASRILIQRLLQHTGAWTCNAQTLEHAVSSGWSAVSGGRSGNCWFAGPNGHKWLDLTDVFVPNPSSILSFWMKYWLGTATFRILVSADAGQTYSVLYQKNNGQDLAWKSYSASLSAYAGKTIQIRFELTSGSYYSGGGVWLDDLSIASGEWSRWVPFAEDDVLASEHYSEVRTEWDDGSDFSLFEKTSSGTTDDWTIEATELGGHCFRKVSPGTWGKTYHLTSREPIMLGPQTHLLLRWKRNLAGDSLRVLVSTNRVTFTEIWDQNGTSDWCDESISLAEFAGQSVYVRLEYVVGSYYPDGGIWIDTISTQEVENPELKGQPIHHTILANQWAEGVYTLASVVEDGASVRHRRSLPFTLTVTSRFRYQTEPNGTATLTGYHGDEEWLMMPEVWNGLPVRGIASNAFSGSPVKYVVVPSSVRQLEASAFSGATALVGVFFEGNAPVSSAGAFAGSSAVIYYRPGATGWLSTLDGRPALMWNPTVAGPAAIQHAGGSYGFFLSGTPGIPVSVFATSNLVLGTWTPLTNTTIGTGGTVFVPDLTIGTVRARIYRFSWP